MIFYASWTTRDPVYQDYDPNACVLVSPGGVPLYWSTREWTNLPKKLFIDSGIFSNIKNGKQPSCQEILNTQLRMAEGWPESEQVYFAHPDLIIPHKMDFSSTQQLIKNSIERSKVYFSLLKKHRRKITPIGVIHGFNEETILSSYQDLIATGYSNFALGSLAVRFSRHKDNCLKIINMAIKYDIKPLHLFGITCPLHEKQILPGIHSYDSSTPAKLGFYGTVLYGKPLKRYVLSPTAEQTQRDLFFKFRESLPEPLPCICPICKNDKSRLLPLKGTQAKHDRAVHNYFQLKWATKKIH